MNNYPPLTYGRKENQHYVPQAYLRFFSNDDKNDTEVLTP